MPKPIIDPKILRDFIEFLADTNFVSKHAIARYAEFEREVLHDMSPREAELITKIVHLLWDEQRKFERSIS